MSKNSKPLNFVAGITLFVLILIVVGLILFSGWVGVTVSLHTTSPLEQIGPYEILTFKFSRPVRTSDVENELQIQPAIPGKLNWINDRTATFIPSSPFFGKISVQLVRGQIGTDGTWLRSDHSWELTVRQPQVVYIASVNNQNQIWIVDVAGKSARQLGKFNKTVFDLDAAPNGEFIIFSALNDKQGSDLWYLDRNGASLRIIADCGPDRCTGPAISADSQQVAYTRETSPLNPSMPMGAPRVRVINIQSSDDRPLYADPQIIGFEPSWSPDGKYITSYDGVQAVIRVVNVQSGEQFTLPSATGDMPSWSPDGENILFTDVAQDSSGSSWTQVKLADMKTQEISVLIGKNDPQDYQYGELAWSPNSHDIVLGTRVAPDSPSRGLWLIQPDLLGGPMIASDPNSIYQTPKWDVWGNELIFEQEETTGSHRSFIQLWSKGLRKPLALAQGALPHWLP